MSKINELRQKKAKLVADARALIKEAEEAKRDLEGDKLAQYNKILDVALGEVDGEIKEAEASESRRKRLEEEETRLKESAGRQSDPSPLGKATGGGADEAREFSYEVRTITGEKRQRKFMLQAQRNAEAKRQAFRRSLCATSPTDDERRSLQMDADTSGGYLVAPQEFVAQIIAIVDNMVFVRQQANVLPPLLKADSVGIPTRENDIADADWTAELATGQEDTTLSFGKRELRPSPMAKLIKISKTLIRKAAIDPEGVVRDRLAYKKGITEEKAFLTGSGTQQPLGVFTLTTNGSGISSARDFNTGNTTTTIGADNLFECKYQLKVQYWKTAQWAFHRDAIKMIAKLKDGDGQYLWQPGLTVGNPDRLLGMPVNISEYVPNTFTTGQYVGILGDFSHYWIVDSLDFTIQVLIERYAENHQNGYIMRAEADGAPTLEEAFSRVKLA